MEFSQTGIDNSNYRDSLNSYFTQTGNLDRAIDIKNKKVDEFNDGLRMGIEPLGVEFGRAGVEGLSGKFRNAVGRNLKNGVEDIKNRIASRISKQAKTISNLYGVDEDKVKGFLQDKQDSLTRAFGTAKNIEDLPQESPNILTKYALPRPLDRPQNIQDVFDEDNFEDQKNPYRFDAQSEDTKADLPLFDSQGQTDAEKATSGLSPEKDDLTAEDTQKPSSVGDDADDEEEDAGKVAEKDASKFAETFAEVDAEGGGIEDVAGDITGILAGVASVAGEKALEKSQVSELPTTELNPSSIKGI